MKRNPHTGQPVGESSRKAPTRKKPTPEELAKADAKNARGASVPLSELESNDDMVRYVDACTDAIRKGSPMTVKEIHAGLVKHYGFKGSFQAVSRYWGKKGLTAQGLRNGK